MSYIQFSQDMMGLFLGSNPVGGVKLARFKAKVRKFFKTIVGYVSHKIVPLACSLVPAPAKAVVMAVGGAVKAIDAALNVRAVGNGPLTTVSADGEETGDYFTVQMQTHVCARNADGSFETIDALSTDDSLWQASGEPYKVFVNSSKAPMARVFDSHSLREDGKFASRVAMYGEYSEELPVLVRAKVTFDKTNADVDTYAVFSYDTSVEAQ